VTKRVFLGALVMAAGLALFFVVPWSDPWRWALLVGSVLLGCIVCVLPSGTEKFLGDTGWAWAIVLIWGGTWILIWIDRVNKHRDFVDEPAAVGLSLGVITIILFSAILMRAEDRAGGIRAAIAASFIVLFLLLVVDLLTISGFRESLTDVRDVEVTVTNSGTSSRITTEACPSPSPEAEPPTGLTGGTETATPSPSPCPPTTAVAISFVEGLFGVFKFGLVTIIIAFFGAEALTTVSAEKTKRTNVANNLTPAGDPRPGSPGAAQDEV